MSDFLSTFKSAAPDPRFAYFQKKWDEYLLGDTPSFCTKYSLEYREACMSVHSVASLSFKAMGAILFMYSLHRVSKLRADDMHIGAMTGIVAAALLSNVPIEAKGIVAVITAAVAVIIITQYPEPRNQIPKFSMNRPQT